MNTLKLASLAHLLESIPDEHFNMAVGVRCGTVGCIFGHWFLATATKDVIAFERRMAYNINPEVNPEWNWASVRDFVREDLELSPDEAEWLAEGEFSQRKLTTQVPIGDCTRQQAISAINAMIAAGGIPKDFHV